MVPMPGEGKCHTQEGANVSLHPVVDCEITHSGVTPIIGCLEYTYD